MSDTRLITILDAMVLLAVALIAGIMAGLSIKAKDASGAAAWSALLMSIVGTIKESRQGRTIDRMGASLANAPPADPPAVQPGSAA